jgi:hypothetical protein
MTLAIGKIYKGWRVIGRGPQDTAQPTKARSVIATNGEETKEFTYAQWQKLKGPRKLEDGANVYVYISVNITDDIVTYSYVNQPRSDFDNLLPLNVQGLVLEQVNLDPATIVFKRL